MHVGDLSTCRTVIHAVLATEAHQAPALQPFSHCTVRLGGLNGPVRCFICWDAVTISSRTGRVADHSCPVQLFLLEWLVRSKTGGAVGTAATAGKVDCPIAVVIRTVYRHLLPRSSIAAAV